MAEVTLRLDVDPTTGRRTVTVGYQSDADALPHEHEEEHRALIAKLFEKGLAGAADTIVIEREGAVRSAPELEPSGQGTPARAPVQNKG